MGKALGVAGSDEAKPGQRGLDLNLPTLVLVNLDSFVCCHVTIIGVCHGIRYSIFLLMLSKKGYVGCSRLWSDRGLIGSSLGQNDQSLRNCKISVIY